MIWLVSILILWNAGMLVTADMLLGRIVRTLFPLTNAHRLEQYRLPLKPREFWVRVSVWTVIYLGGNSVLIVLLVRGI